MGTNVGTKNSRSKKIRMDKYGTKQIKHLFLMGFENHYGAVRKLIQATREPLDSHF